MRIFKNIFSKKQSFKHVGVVHVIVLAPFSSCKIVTKMQLMFLSHIVYPTFQVCQIHNQVH
jgi:hypothetical protein